MNNLSVLENRLEDIEIQQNSTNNLLIEIQKQNVVTQTALKNLLELFEEESEEVENTTLSILQQISNKIELVASAIEKLVKEDPI